LKNSGYSEIVPSKSTAILILCSIFKSPLTVHPPSREGHSRFGGVPYDLISVLSASGGFIVYSFLSALGGLFVLKNQ
jgi:hypothetical protein